MFEAAHASTALGLVAVLLDRAKAFDRIKHDALLQALRRFGMPDCMVDMIAGIYSERNSIIQGPAGGSSVRQQRVGIARGCPLSPYLFITIQSVPFIDVDARMAGARSTVRGPVFIPRSDSLCAGDAMLAGRCADKLQCLSDA
eukprot:3013714-Pyramimonas_sp.AAC.1